MTKAVESLTGTDLINFREAMLRAGLVAVVGKIINADIHVAGDIPFTIDAPGTIVIIGFATANRVGAARPASGSVYTASGGGGTQVFSSLLGNLSWDGTLDNASITNFSSYIPTTAKTLYLNVSTPSDAACTMDILLLGLRVDSLPY